MRNVVLTLICLTPSFLVFFYALYEESLCLSESEAEDIYKSAQLKENQGEHKVAYHLYKQIDACACENYDLRAKAFNKTLSLKKD